MSKTYRSLSELRAMIGEQGYRAALQALDAGADKIVEDARTRCPVHSGALRASIHKEKREGGKRFRIVADAQSSTTGICYGRLVAFSPKINHPFLYPALDANRDAIRAAIRDAVRRAVER